MLKKLFGVKLLLLLFLVFSSGTVLAQDAAPKDTAGQEEKPAQASPVENTPAQTEAPEVEPVGDNPAEPADSQPGGEAAGDLGAETPTVEVDGKEKAEEEEKEGKWWSLTFAYDFSHNFSKERPRATNGFSITPGFVLPWDVSISAAAGFYVDTAYEGEGPAAFKGKSFNTVDMNPVSLTITRVFKIDPEYTGFSVTALLSQLFPYSSKYAGRVKEWHYAISPGVGIGFEKWGISLGNTNKLQKNFHAHPYYRYFSEGGWAAEPLNEYTYSNTSSLRYSVWKISTGLAFTWSRNWSYHPERQEQHKNNVAYAFDFGIDVWEGLNLSTGVTTAGPERQYGGFKNDQVLPLDPIFTTAFLAISYTL